MVAGDDASISVGANSNVQDGAVIGTGKTYIGQPRGPTLIGNNVTVGHSAILDGVTLEDECLVGIGAILPHGVTVSVTPIFRPPFLISAVSDHPSTLLRSPFKIPTGYNDPRFLLVLSFSGPPGPSFSSSLAVRTAEVVLPLCSFTDVSSCVLFGCSQEAVH